jgi:DNA/RNA-binding domain of Phe-tRNA-synthetase-like protein
MEITIDISLKEAAPLLAIGAVFATVEVTKHDPVLWTEIDKRVADIVAQTTLHSVPEMPEVKALRDAYRVLGKDPSRYRGSQESLLRRVLQGKGLFRINTAVDINNLVSLESAHSVGCYDAERLQPPVTFRVGKAGEAYRGIGKESINLDGLPVFADGAGPFGSPTSDSERAMITLNTREIMMLIIAFSGSAGLSQFAERATTLLSKYAKARPETLQYKSIS